MDCKEQVVKALSPLASDLAGKWAEGATGNFVMLKAKALKYISSIGEGMACELESDVNKNDTSALWTQLWQVWKRLNTAEEYTALFVKSFERMKPEFTLEALKEELARCEKEKKVKMESYTTALRAELKELWGKCLVKADDQKGIFQVHSTTFSEEVMRSCELKLQKWKGFYASNEKMILAIRDYETVWLKWNELVESIEKDSNRFQNRKGILLDQEKDKTIAKKAVHKAEETVQNLNAAFKRETGKDFTVRGQSVLDYIHDEVALSEVEIPVKRSKEMSGANNRGHMSSQPTPLKRLKKPSLIPRPTLTTKKTLSGRNIVNTTEKLRRRSAKLRQARLAVFKKSSNNAESVDQSQPVVPGPSTSHTN